MEIFPQGTARDIVATKFGISTCKNDPAKDRKALETYVSLRGYKQGGNGSNQYVQTCQDGTFAKSTLEEIAKELNMSKRNLQRALRIERNLTDTMKELLDTGEITKSIAYEGSHYDMDINIERYFNGTGSSGKSLLNRWYRNNFKKFYQKHENEYEEGNRTFCAIYRLYADGEISRKQFKKIKKHTDPLQTRPVSKFLIMFPQYIHSWLCCGWRVYNPETKAWELDDNVHMLSKLCRHKTWDDVKITWRDKIRFWLITGYKFEKDGESY